MVFVAAAAAGSSGSGAGVPWLEITIGGFGFFIAAKFFTKK